MAKLRLKELYIQDLSKGLDTLSPDISIDPREAPTALNVEYIERGYPSKRRGITSVISDAPESLDGIGTFVTAAGNKYIVYISDGIVKRVSGSSSVTITGVTLTDGLNCTFTQVLDKLFIHNGTDNMCQVTNALVLSQPANGKIAKFGINFKSRHVVAGNSSSPSTLYYSVTADPSDFSSAGSGSFAVQNNDGDKITGLCVYQDALFVFKERAIYKMVEDSTGATLFSGVELVTRGMGCVSHKTIESVENDIFFLGRKGGGNVSVNVLGNESGYFDVLRTKELSSRIQPDLSNINSSQLERSSAIFYDNKYILAIADGGSSVNNIVFVYHRPYMAWARWEGWYPNSFTVIQDSNGADHLYFADDNSTYVMEALPNGVYSDNNQAYTFRWRSKKISPDNNWDKTNIWHNLTLHFRKTIGSVTLYVYIDGTKYNYGVIDFAVGTGGFNIDEFNSIEFNDTSGTSSTGSSSTSTKRASINKRGKTIQVELEDTLVNSQIALMAIGLSFRTLSHWVFNSSDKI